MQKSRFFQQILYILIYVISCFIYAGSLLGTVLNFNSTGIDFSMTALFLVVFVEQWCSMKNHISAVAFSAFCDFWRRQENTGLYHLFIFCFALCHYGNVSYLLSEKCESGYSTTWTAWFLVFQLNNHRNRCYMDANQPCNSGFLLPFFPLPDFLLVIFQFFWIGQRTNGRGKNNLISFSIWIRLSPIR